MLIQLSIRHYAIIDELDIRFSDGLNIITGETGAGKSILMGALGLVLGDRADTQVLHEPDRKLVVEALFRIPLGDRLQEFFLHNDLDVSEEIIIRREISPQGKSRAFVNDTPVNLSQLRELSGWLVDLHQQFDTLDVGREDFQREALDAFCGCSDDARKLSARFSAYDAARKNLQEARDRQRRASQEKDYHQYLFDELQALQIKDHELEELEKEIKLLTHAGTVKQQLTASVASLTEGEQPLGQQLKAIAQKLKQVAAYHPELPGLLERLQSAQVEITDISDELQRVNDAMDLSAERLQWVEERLSAYYSLMKKHGLQDASGLMALRDELALKLGQAEQLNDQIASLEKQVSSLQAEAMKIAEAISAVRIKKAPSLVKEVNALLHKVGMPNARMQVSIVPAPLNASGIDAISFLFDANKTNRFEPIGKVASGGELSRLMLSIKSLVASKMKLPTLIFDEIDTGISGEAARQVGLIMQELGTEHQLIAITHQPQIAAKANAHFYVYKQEELGKVKTRVRSLSKDERIETIARMLSGEKPSTAALENARELVGG